MSYDAVIAGHSLNTLTHSLKSYDNVIGTLFMSCEPLLGIINTNALIKLIERSNIQKIVLGFNLEPILANRTWHAWAAQWKGKIQILNRSPTLERINYGIQKTYQQGQPWVNFISAANLNGNPVDLSSLMNEFGFLNYLNNQIQQSSLLLCGKSQADIVGHLSLKNNMKGCIEVLEINKPETLRSLLRHCTNQRVFSVTVLGDFSSLAYYLKNNLVDEVIHHVAHASHNTMNIKKYEHSNNNTNALNKLKTWRLTESEIVGECSRLIFCRKTPKYSSGRGTN